MLDRWIYGSAKRISPEAPVPILKEKGQKYSVGGAGNLALNISSVNGEVDLYGAIGQDKDGYKLLEILEKTKLNVSTTSDANVTTTKTRLVGQGGQHIMRWDREEKYKWTSAQERLVTSLKEDDIVCVSDYNKGTVRKDTVAKILEKTPTVLVDPKQESEFYKGAFLVKPNMKEYKEWFGKFNREVALFAMKEHDWKWLVVTDGKNGMHVLNIAGEYQHFKEEVKEVADVTGAGDTVLAVIAYGVEQGWNIFETCKLACYAAARSVERRGVVTITQEDLKPKVVWTNGVFDILHEGHFKLLKFASQQGQKLVVGINSDASTKRLKGEDRPINTQLQRKMNLELLPWVDEVIIFDEDTPLEALKKVNPGLVIKGGDYTIDTVVGHELFPTKIFPYIENVSTTQLIDEIKKQKQV